MGTSTCLQQHTESSRMMRGAWKADGEYIPELHTQRDRKTSDKTGLSQVGCDGLDARYRVGVFLTVNNSEQQTEPDVPAKAMQRERRANKGGNTGVCLVLFRTGLFNCIGNCFLCN